MSKIIFTSMGWCTLTEEKGEQVITPLDEDRVYQIKKETLNKRSVLQNSSLHKYYSLVANALNEAGLDIKETIKADVPWSMEQVKNLMWKPLQKALLDKKSTTSTTSLKSDEVTKVYEVMNRYLGEKLKLESIDFPSQESMMREQNKDYYERGR